jgi:hypothetical protein
MKTFALLLLALLTLAASAQPARRPPAARAPASAWGDPQQEATRRYLWRLWQLEQQRMEVCGNLAAGIFFSLPMPGQILTQAEQQRLEHRVDFQIRQGIREMQILLQKIDRERPSVPARCQTLHDSFRYFVAVDLGEAQRALALDRAGRTWEIKRLDRPNPAKLACEQANRALSEVFRLQGVPQTFTFAEKGYGE